MTDQGTRIVIYNLWEDDQGELELDFNADKYDIQLRGVNRDEKRIQMAKQFPNSRHFLTYQHSLRSYASILYLRLPRGFKMVLRGKEIEHHNIVNDMMLKQEVTYKPQSFGDGAPRDQNMVAVVIIGFVKDAKDHIDIQGFNVYHKNRLIKEADVACNRSAANYQNYDVSSLEQLKFENHELKNRLKQVEDDIISLTEKLEEAEKKLAEANRDQEALVDIFSEERSRRDKEEEILRKKLKDAAVTIQELLEKLTSNRNNKRGC